MITFSERYCQYVTVEGQWGSSFRACANASITLPNFSLPLYIRPQIFDIYVGRLQRCRNMEPVSCIINRPGVARAVLQTPLLFIKWSFLKITSKHCLSQAVRARDLKSWHNIHHLQCVRCHICHMSYVTCQVWTKKFIIVEEEKIN